MPSCLSLAGGTLQAPCWWLATYPERAGADVWVMQAGVSNMHMANSILPSSLKGAVEEMPGVQDVTPILYVSSPEEYERRWQNQDKFVMLTTTT